ncbi:MULTISPECIES: cardiolipin synthase [unclassified Lentimonas]|uniref:cardiolipin synthase n=1 Tax=unclassified Lentimonas TaxID=2630993 RepID=UPI001321A075|nr:MULTISPECIES: cardiolipin synthase [unclassified Lentimonas]CAA6678418.1 Cardiolipin synthetase (EC [Lentimonas sp. CC4]CAA6685510.1 Cardiolipin synthetase (EC [Lentimonas sp. CC6]CAA6690505.1 Cardiolipin synthetase (EC [Lentimonas sp. CC10]CAA6693246.1 Cardiolipin synthetase (EC [Lentimonas sp. CC19]CAA7068763.1 Cardiolipin synthetase (EC [Lentimonas sp. CC11]
MTDYITIGSLTSLAYVLLHVGIILRAVLRPNREPASRVAWVVVIIVIPIAGMIAYLLFGETSIGRKRVARMKKVVAEIEATMRAQDPESELEPPNIPEKYAHLFQVGSSINQFIPVGANSGCLLEDSNATIDAIVADIDTATEHVHLIFYIWLTDNNGLKIVDALKRAAARSVTCRVMADGLGSRSMVSSKHWKAMQAAGVHVAVALPIGNPLLRPLHGRIDLRNHRKIVVIDHCITYCGSQNCADPEFLVKAKYAPWVDAMIRFEGPIAHQNQQLFASDWMGHVDENLNELLQRKPQADQTGFPAQVIGTGPTVRYSAMSEVFETLIYAARQEICITTPYYVPNESMQEALCACARRGVTTTIIFPARNDSWIVGAASHSYYADLLEAGVRIFEYKSGLLHTKSLTLDNDITLIGSANMDRRSFELNYENNILLYDPKLTQTVCERQAHYLADSKQVTLEMVAAWPITRRLWNNTIGMLGPIL